MTGWVSGPQICPCIGTQAPIRNFSSAGLGWGPGTADAGADAESPNNFENLSGEAENTEKDGEIKKRRWAGAMLCRALQRGLGCHGTSKDRWTRRPEKPCARRPPGGRDTNNCGSESPCPLTLCGIGQLPTGGLNPLLCERHATPPCPPPQGAGVPCREKGHKRVLHTARPQQM